MLHLGDELVTFGGFSKALGARLIGWDAGISLTAGVDRETLRTTPLFGRAVDILRNCEDLRHAQAFNQATRSKLREPGRNSLYSRMPRGNCVSGARNPGRKPSVLPSRGHWRLT